MGAIKRLAEDMGYFQMSEEEQEKFVKEFEEGTLEIPEKFVKKDKDLGRKNKE